MNARGKSIKMSEMNLSISIQNLGCMRWLVEEKQAFQNSNFPHITPISVKFCENDFPYEKRSIKDNFG